jgi:hypothetical protein
MKLTLLPVPHSPASWITGPGLVMYTASKHAILGMMRGISPQLQEHGIRTATIHPWFAGMLMINQISHGPGMNLEADTNILPTTAKIALAGIPMTPLPRIAGTVICAATDPDMSTNGAAWTLLDHGPVLRLEQEKLKEGVYGLMDARNKRIAGMISGTRIIISTTQDLLKIAGSSRIPKALTILAVVAALSKTRARVYFWLAAQWLTTVSKTFW